MIDPTIAHGRTQVKHGRDPSDQCGESTTTGRMIADSQRLLAQGSCRPTYESPPRLFAMLIDPSLEPVAKARGVGEENTRAQRGHAVIVEGRRARFPWDVALARWEDDGGRLDRRHER